MSNFLKDTTLDTIKVPVFCASISITLLKLFKLSVISVTYFCMMSLSQALEFPLLGSSPLKSVTYELPEEISDSGDESVKSNLNFLYIQLG